MHVGHWDAFGGRSGAGGLFFVCSCPGCAIADGGLCCGMVALGWGGATLQDDNVMTKGSRMPLILGRWRTGRRRAKTWGGGWGAVYFAPSQSRVS